MRDELLDFAFLEPAKLLERLRTYFGNELPELTITTSKMKKDGIVINAKVHSDGKEKMAKMCYLWAYYNDRDRVVGYKFYYERNDSKEYIVLCDYNELLRHIKIALARERVYMVIKK